MAIIVDLPYTIANRYRLASIHKILDAVNALEEEVSKRSDEEMNGAAAMLRRRLSMGEAIDDVMPEAFALVREAGKRMLDERHYDVQVLGGAAMHQGWIAEMETGEGKTLTATMPAFLNALTGRGVHIVTVNDYLAQRDTEWMGAIYQYLGLTVGCLVHGVDDAERVQAYQADITYGTNKEFAFDYLRDQLRKHAMKPGHDAGLFERQAIQQGMNVRRVQREHNFAIVDEIDSILIDESRVPLIISGREEGLSPYSNAYHAAAKAASHMREGQDYTVEVEKRRVELAEAGMEKAREVKGVELPPGRPFEHMVAQALRADRLYQRDREYLLMEDKVCIVDEFTGRQMPDRSWSLGLHQAVEAKEKVPVTNETRTQGTVTFQRYFKFYRKLAGMTGTARNARREFWKVFDLRVASIPTNRPMRRQKLPYRIFTTLEEKYEATMDRIVEIHLIGRPVLVGTRSVGRSEEVSRRLEERGIKHDVLNARNHAAEAAVITEAGTAGNVCISTNMAGRGVDIKLKEGVADLGGLHVLATELHEATRIDRQLAGRAGRQGDPGTYEFYLCLEDEIIGRWSKLVAAAVVKLAKKRGGRPSGWFHRLIFFIAQRWIERRHLRIRLDLLDYDKHIEEMKGNLGVPVWG